MILGHKDILESLQQLALAGRLSHGYLFWGADGVGKKPIACALAASLEDNGPQDIHASTDSFIVEPHAEEAIGIDAIREVRMKLSQMPLRAKRRVAIIDRADRMTPEAQNALLKIAEEPFSHALIILIATDPQNILPTLQSRLQKIYFAPLAQGDIETWLTKECAISRPRAQEIASKCFGRPGLAIRLDKEEKLQSDIAAAEKLLLATAAIRKTALKTIVSADDFSLPAFVDALVLVVSWRRDEARMRALLSALLSLRVRAEGVPLNPRIQLESVFQQANIQ